MTITVKFPAALEADLRRHAQAQGLATSLVVREAVAQYLLQAQASAPASAASLGADLFGRYSGPAELASQRKAALADVWDAKHAGAPTSNPGAAPQRGRGHA
ncbi:MAG: hypothetical protein QE285_15445 [Aquabacterium sp.]|nr:hypothetical protein [Aquabacterium sp.]